MCPLCITTAVLSAAGASSGAGAIAVAASRWRSAALVGQWLARLNSGASEPGEVDSLEGRFGAETGEPMARLAMAWVFQSPGVTTVLIGARGRAHIDNAVTSREYRLAPEIKARMDSWLA